VLTLWARATAAELAAEFAATGGGSAHRAGLVGDDFISTLPTCASVASRRVPPAYVHEGRSTQMAGARFGDSPWLELRIALAFFATIVAWAVLSSWLGTGVSLTVVLSGLGLVAAVSWRRHLTPEVLTGLAVYGIPVAVVALWWT
jgi:hypothetical protein